MQKSLFRTVPAATCCEIKENAPLSGPTSALQGTFRHVTFFPQKILFYTYWVLHISHAWVGRDSRSLPSADNLLFLSSHLLSLPHDNDTSRPSPSQAVVFLTPVETQSRTSVFINACLRGTSHLSLPNPNIPAPPFSSHPINLHPSPIPNTPCPCLHCNSPPPALPSLDTSPNPVLHTLTTLPHPKRPHFPEFPVPPPNPHHPLTVPLPEFQFISAPM